MIFNAQPGPHMEPLANGLGSFDAAQGDHERPGLNEARKGKQQRRADQRERVHRPVERGEITTPRPQRERQRGDHADSEEGPGKILMPCPGQIGSQFWMPSV